MFVELRELLRSGAIRRHQLGSKYILPDRNCHKADPIVTNTYALN